MWCLFPNAAPSHGKKSHLASQYRRLAGRRGKKRALIAVAHSMLVVFCHMLNEAAAYAYLGSNLFDTPQTQRLTHYYLKRFGALGHKITLETCVAA